MGLATNLVCASCQLEEETALHFVCVCPTLATLRTRIFGRPIMNALEITEVSANAILRFAFQSGRLETNLWHNSLKCVRRLLIYDSSIKCSFCFFSAKLLSGVAPPSHQPSICFWWSNITSLIYFEGDSMLLMPNK
jgi:hypothetical protein